MCNFYLSSHIRTIHVNNSVYLKYANAFNIVSCFLSNEQIVLRDLTEFRLKLSSPVDFNYQNYIF